MTVKMQISRVASQKCFQHSKIPSRNFPKCFFPLCFFSWSLFSYNIFPNYERHGNCRRSSSNAPSSACYWFSMPIKIQHKNLPMFLRSLKFGKKATPKKWFQKNTTVGKKLGKSTTGNVAMRNKHFRETNINSR